MQGGNEHDDRESDLRLVDADNHAETECLSEIIAALTTGLRLTKDFGCVDMAQAYRSNRVLLRQPRQVPTCYGLAK